MIAREMPYLSAWCRWDEALGWIAMTADELQALSRAG